MTDLRDAVSRRQRYTRLQMLVFGCGDLAPWGFRTGAGSLCSGPDSEPKRVKYVEAFPNSADTQIPIPPPTTQIISSPSLRQRNLGWSTRWTRMRSRLNMRFAMNMRIMQKWDCFTEKEFEVPVFWGFPIPAPSYRHFVRPPGELCFGQEPVLCPARSPERAEG